MLLRGSCHCRAVRFSVRSRTPFPYLWCYCSICRKTAGGGGYAINIMGEAKSLRVRGARNLSIYRAKLSPRAKTRSSGRRHFCRKCGTALWLYDPAWPDWIYPFASAIDTPLPRPPERQHVFLSSKPAWVEVPKGRGERRFRDYSGEWIIHWHGKRGLLR